MYRKKNKEFLYSVLVFNLILFRFLFVCFLLVSVQRIKPLRGDRPRVEIVISAGLKSVPALCGEPPTAPL